MFERFTDRARRVMALSNQEAQRFNHEVIDPEHVLLGMVKEPGCLGVKIMQQCGIDHRKVRLEVEKLIKSGPDMVTMGNLPQTPRTKKVIDFAIQEARSLKHNYVGTEHLLMGLIPSDSIASTVLKSLGLTIDKAKEALGQITCEDAPAGDKAEAGRTFAQCFTADMARMSQTINSVSVNVDLRDYFAGQALYGLTQIKDTSRADYQEMMHNVARLAYGLADAMITARKQEPQP